MREIKFLPPDYNGDTLNFNNATRGFYIGLVQDFEIIPSEDSQVVVPVTYCMVRDYKGTVEIVPPKFIQFVESPFDEVINTLDQEGFDREKAIAIISKAFKYGLQ